MTNKNLILTRKKAERVVVHVQGKKICTITVTDISQKSCSPFTELIITKKAPDFVSSPHKRGLYF